METLSQVVHQADQVRTKVARDRLAVLMLFRKTKQRTSMMIRFKKSMGKSMSTSYLSDTLMPENRLLEEQFCKLPA